MQTYPIQLTLKGRTCLVAGGGRVAVRKIRRLLAADAQVRVVSPVLAEELADLAEAGSLEIFKRAYTLTDMDGVMLVFAATSDREVNARIARDAAAQGILCNVADDSERSDFTLPAVVRKGDVMLAVSTGGRSPALSKWLRRKLTTWLGPEYAAAADILGQVRDQLLSAGHDPEGHRLIFTALLEKGLVEMIQASDVDGIRRLLDVVAGLDTLESSGTLVIRGLDEWMN